MMIPYGKHEISKEDKEAILEVLESNFLTQGPKVPEFEKLLADKVGAKFAVAVNSATSALHIACLSIGLKAGDRLWTTPISFVASANCGLYCGAKVEFVDIDPLTNNICVKALEKKLSEAKAANALPKIVVAVHFSGFSCDMKQLFALSQKYAFEIIEDASHALGGLYYDEYIGCCHYSTVTVFSLHPVKIITTGEGGIAITNNKNIEQKMRLYAGHGITRDPKMMVGTPDGPWHYEQVELGYNYRMTDIQAALGISQSQRLDQFVAKRNELATNYDKMLDGFPVTLPAADKKVYSSRHLYVLRLNLEEIKVTRLETFNYLRKHGVGVAVHYIPITHHPFFAQMGYDNTYLPEADRFYQQAITLPLFPSMTDHQQNTVVNTLRDALSAAG